MKTEVCAYCGLRFPSELARDGHERSCAQWYVMQDIAGIIIDCTAEVCAVSPEAILSECRAMPLPAARMLAAWQMKRLGMSLHNMGKALCRSHATVVHYLSNYEFALKQIGFLRVWEAKLERAIEAHFAGTSYSLTPPSREEMEINQA